jgi:hypothetical protein
VGLAAGHPVKPAAQLSTQAPSEQLLPAAQAVPHVPQLAGSVRVLVQIGAVPELVPGQAPVVEQ